MDRLHTAPRVVFLAVAVLLGACAPRPRLDYSWLADQMQTRTGHTPRDAAVAESEIPDVVSLEDGLSQDEAVALALWNNAAFRETLAQLGLSRGALMQAGLLTNPVFAVLFPLGPKQLEFALKLPVEAVWLRPKRVAAAQLDAEQVAEQLLQGGLDVARDAKVKWVELRLARARAAIADETVGVATQVDTLTEARLEAGDVSPLEAGIANTDALTAREEAIRLHHEEAIAEQRLRSVLRLRASGTLSLESSATLATPVPEASSLVDLAWAARPDLRAAELTTQAAGERAGLSRWEVLSLAGIADAKHERGRGLLVGPGLEVGIPIFDHNQAGMARADAEVVRAARGEEAVRDRIALEVQEAAARYADAVERSALLTEQVVPELERATRRAEESFAAGETSRLETLVARTQLLRARAREADAVAALASARAELERSVGYRLDAPPPSERAASR